MSTNRPVKRTVAVGIFVVLFGGGFVLMGIVAGVLPLYEQVQTWRAARSYVAVPAEVLAVELVRKGKARARDNYHVEASLRYTYAGRTHAVPEVASGTGDATSSYHSRIHRTLQGARDAGRAATVWINPDQPGQVILDRDFRWLRAIMHLPFAIVFPLVGISASAGLLWTSRQPTVAEGASEPPLDGSVVLYLITAIWNLITWPFAIFVMHELAYAPRWGMEPLILVFPVIGLFLLRMSWTNWRERAGAPAA